MRHRLLRILGTTSGRLLALVMLIVIAVNAGALLVVITGDFDSYPEAGWWAFRHVVDPGTLSDDAEWDERFIGTGLMVVGVVVFVGVVFALLTDIVQRSLERLNESQGQVRARAHIVILGWSSLVPPVLDEIEAIIGADPPTRRAVVVVAPASLRVERERLQAELRSHRHAFPTDLLFAEDDDAAALDLASVTTAHAVLVVRNDTRAVDPLAADVNALGRAALLAERLADAVPRPLVSYYVTRDESLAAATKALPADFIPIVGNRAISGMLRMALLTPAWGRFLAGGTTPESRWDLELLRADRLAGRRLDELTTALLGRLPLGVRPADGGFSTTGDRRLGPDDAVVAVPAAQEWSRSVAADPQVRIDDASPGELHVLIVGWNDRVPTLIDDLALLEHTRIRVTSASDVSADARTAAIPREQITKTRAGFLDSAPGDQRALSALLRDVAPDRVIVVSTPGGAVSDPELELPAADAQAVVTATLLASIQGGTREVLVDLYVPGSAAPLRRIPGVEVLPAASVQAFTLARLVAGPEHGSALIEIFGDDQNPPLIGRMTTGDGGPRAFAAVRATGLVAAVSVVGVVVDGVPWLAPPPEHPVPAGSELLLLRGRDTRVSPGSVLTRPEGSG